MISYALEVSFVLFLAFVTGCFVGCWLAKVLGGRSKLEPTSTPAPKGKHQEKRSRKKRG